MTFSSLSHLECSRDGSRHDADAVQGTSPLGAPLLARYEVDRVTVTRDEIASRPPTLWRYAELLPVRDPARVMSLGEGMTPLLDLPRHGARLDVPTLRMKDEGLIPTGAFKARGAAVGVSRAAELGVTGIAMPTNGNAGAAWAAYAARAGLGALIAMPVDAPEITRRECVVTGAELYLVDGLIGDAGALIRQAVATRTGYQDTSTLREPYRIEGKKTMGIELAEQLGWEVPDVIFYPTGGGTGIIGMWKAFDELEAIGWIGSKRPRMVVVQAAGCAPMVKAWEEGVEHAPRWQDAHTFAAGIRVPQAVGDFLILRAVRESGGFATAVDDSEIAAAWSEVAAEEGFLLCPEGAATYAAYKR
ncbi:MAG: threonine synthase, partial [Gemmatimonadales bacterium]